MCVFFFTHVEALGVLHIQSEYIAFYQILFCPSLRRFISRLLAICMHVYFVLRYAAALGMSIHLTFDLNLLAFSVALAFWMWRAPHAKCMLYLCTR